MERIDLDTVDSTNTYLKNNYSGLRNMTFVSALLQTAGRGRKNRRWLSEKGQSLLFSLLLLDPFYLDHHKKLSLLSAYSVIKALEKYGIKNLTVKWPNDVYAGDEKICGILLEAVSRDRMECLIIGIGLNVNQKSFEGEYLRQPTSVYLQRGCVTDLEELKAAVYAVMEENLEKLKSGHDFFEQIAAYDYLKGKTVFAEIKGLKTEAEVKGINEDCTLRICCGDNEFDIDSGEISFHL